MKHLLLGKLKILLATVLVVTALLAAYLITPVFGNKVLIVRSGSMAPTLPVGSLVAIRPKELIISPLPAVPLYSPGDVISFKDSRNPKVITTHRVVSYKIENSQILYQTKGDANSEPDQTLVAERNVLGATFLSLPYLGVLFAFTKTKIGFLILVLIPALVVIILESWNIFKEVRKKRPLRYTYLKNFRIKQNPTLTSLLPLLAVGLVFAQTSAYFSDTATSTSNVFAAAETFPTAEPGPGDIVVNEVYYDLCSPASTCGTEPQNEWIELYNNTNSAIDISGWTITENQNDPATLPNGTIIAANGFLVVTPETQTFDFWPGVPSGIRVILGEHFGNGLANTDDRVILKNTSSVTIDAMSWGGDLSAFTPSAADVASGHSLEREPDGTDTDTAADFVNRTIPSPGI